MRYKYISLVQVLKGSRNITIATFATHGLYKKEAYEANVWAGKILSEHGVPVAYKSVSGTADICYYANIHRITPNNP